MCVWCIYIYIHTYIGVIYLYIDIYICIYIYMHIHVVSIRLLLLMCSVNTPPLINVFCQYIYHRNRDRRRLASSCVCLCVLSIRLFVLMCSLSTYTIARGMVSCLASSRVRVCSLNTPLLINVLSIYIYHSKGDGEALGEFARVGNLVNRQP
jgi:hypothetical protein